MVRPVAAGHTMTAKIKGMNDNWMTTILYHSFLEKSIRKNGVFYEITERIRIYLQAIGQQTEPVGGQNYDIAH